MVDVARTEAIFFVKVSTRCKREDASPFHSKDDDFKRETRASKFFVVISNARFFTAKSASNCSRFLFAISSLFSRSRFIVATLTALSNLFFFFSSSSSSMSSKITSNGSSSVAVAVASSSSFDCSFGKTANPVLFLDADSKMGKTSFCNARSNWRTCLCKTRSFDSACCFMK